MLINHLAHLTLAYATFCLQTSAPQAGLQQCLLWPRAPNLPGLWRSAMSATILVVANPPPRIMSSHGSLETDAAAAIVLFAYHTKHTRFGLFFRSFEPQTIKILFPLATLF